MSFVDSIPASTMLNNAGWPHVYIAAAAFLICMFVTFVILLSSGKIKINPNETAFTYLKFFYATFLKPHESGGEGQQGALESFYKTQVWESRLDRDKSLMERLRHTMQHGDRFFAVGKICWHLSLRS